MPMWCVSNDPCGICCACVTHFLLFFADYVVVFSVLHPWFGAEGKFFFHSFCFVGISLLAVCSHLRAMLTDPGTVLIHETRDLEAHPAGSMCSLAWRTRICDQQRTEPFDQP